MLAGMVRTPKGEAGPLMRITPAWRRRALEEILKGWSGQKAFAKHLGIGTGHLNQILRDERMQHSHWVGRIAEALSIPPPTIELEDPGELDAVTALRQIREVSHESYEYALRTIQETVALVRRLKNP